MFNPDLKNAFLDTQKAQKTKSIAQSFFNKTEPYETELGDLYAWKPETIVEVFRKLGFTSIGTARTYLTLTRTYCSFCAKQGIVRRNNAELVQPETLIDTELYKAIYVESPDSLLEYLKTAFSGDISNDNRVKVFKVYYWLAFSGVPIQDLMKVTPKTIQGDTITIENRVYYIHEYAKSIIFELLAVTDINTPIINTCSQKITTENMSVYISALMKPEMPRLKYANVYRSGLFYRIYEQEKQGFPVRFDAEIELQIQLTGYAGHGNSLQKRKRTMQATLLKDYNAWKTAFGL